ncbi:MAG: YiiX/YebB-like N1pC/P60 family cysteine hydrolase [Planctomycetaceae bacterium]
MSLLLLAATLAVAAEPVASFDSAQQAAQTVAEQSQTGTLIFSRGDCLAIKVFGGGPYTHVGAVVVEDGKATVYDCMPGKGVRKQSLEDFLESQDPDVIHVAHLKQAMTEEQGRAFVEHLESELGRPYAVKHHLTGQRAEGIHCSEYTTDALMACNLLHANHPSRVSPASLAEGIFRDELYAPAQTFVIAPAIAEETEPHNRCHQLWLDTKTCTANCCVKMRRLFLCR